MSQEYVLLRRRKEKSWVDRFWEWLEEIGGWILALGRFLMSLGWLLVQIARFIYNLVAQKDWREEYR